MQEQRKLDAKEVKNKVKDFLEMAGPSLPINVAKHLGINTLFTSAFLSEMAAEGIVKISDMKVGGSPLYYTPERVHTLENFIIYLGGKEKEACQLLKEKHILENSEQHPSIRVALRSLKDFAFPMNKDGKIFWRYFKITETEAHKIIEASSPEYIQRREQEAAKIEADRKEKERENLEMEKMKQELEEKRKELEKLKQEMIKKPEEPKPVLISEPEKPKKLKLKPEEKFLEEIKEILSKKGIEIINIEKADKKEAAIRIRFNGRQFLLAAFNKKKIEEKDLLKAYKKAQSISLPYIVFSKGEVSKKTKETIEAYRKLAAIERMDASEEAQEKPET